MGKATDRYTQSSKETDTGKCRPDKYLPTSLRGIARIAKSEPKRKFGGLYSFLNETNLKAAYYELNKKAAVGVDGVDYRLYGQHLDENVRQLTEELKGKRYHAKLVRRVYIPKGKNTTRPLGILSVSDKCAQSVAAKILSAIYEQDFMDYSYAYRPNRDAKLAIEEMRISFLEHKCGWVVESDVKSFFDTIDHDILIKMLQERIEDRAFLGLIRKWLRAGILESDNHVIHPATGTPQGGIVSGVLSNIYLHYSLDLWFQKRVKPSYDGEAFMVRYADDFVVVFQFHRDAKRFYTELRDRLKVFGLEMAEDKSRLFRFNRFRKRESKRFDFLGFEFRWGRSKSGHDCIKQRTSRKKMRKSLASLSAWCRKNRNKRLRTIFSKLGSKLVGYYNYYGISGNSKSLKVFYDKVVRILYKWLNRRSQRRSFNWKTYREIINYYKLPFPRIVWGREIQVSMDFG